MESRLIYIYDQDEPLLNFYIDVFKDLHDIELTCLNNFSTLQEQIKVMLPSLIIFDLERDNLGHNIKYENLSSLKRDFRGPIIYTAKMTLTEMENNILGSKNIIPKPFNLQYFLNTVERTLKVEKIKDEQY